MTDNRQTSGHGLAPRAVYTAYATGFFSLGLVPTMAVFAPLWALELDASPFVIGAAVGARSLLPLVFAIPCGNLMDRLGARRVMLWTGGLCVAVSPLYPVLPWIPALMVLQMLFGLGQGLSWMGAQTEVGRLTGGDAELSGRFSFCATLGAWIGPMALGACWDVGGPEGGFALLTAWCAALWIATALMPVPPSPTPASAAPAVRGSEGGGWRRLVPRPGDYAEAFALLALPAVALVGGATFLRIALVGIQSSFYTVYLDSIPIAAATIGALIGFASAVGTPAALLAGPLTRWLAAPWLLIAVMGVATVAIGVTPLFAGVAPLFFFSGLYGVATGLGLPLILSILSRSAGEDRQGVNVGLRTTINRLASLVVPVAMGGLIELFGLTGGFAIVTAILLAFCAATALAARRVS